MLERINTLLFVALIFFIRFQDAFAGHPSHEQPGETVKFMASSEKPFNVLMREFVSALGNRDIHEENIIVVQADDVPEVSRAALTSRR